MCISSIFAICRENHLRGSEHVSPPQWKIWGELRKEKKKYFSYCQDLLRWNIFSRVLAAFLERLTEHKTFMFLYSKWIFDLGSRGISQQWEDNRDADCVCSWCYEKTDKTFSKYRYFTFQMACKNVHGIKRASWTELCLWMRISLSNLGEMHQEQ